MRLLLLAMATAVLSVFPANAADPTTPSLPTADALKQEITPPVESKSEAATPVTSPPTEPAPITASPPVSATQGSPAAQTPAVTRPALDPAKFKAAVDLYNAKKFPEAAVKFQQIVKDGTADDDTHRYLAGTYQQMKKYTKAAAEYEWLSKNARSMTMKRLSKESARTLRSQIAGICPMPCLKSSSPWMALTVDGHPPTDRWVKFTHSGGWNAFSQRHIGNLIKADGVNPAEDLGKCPRCGGTGRVPPLKDQ